MINTNIAGLIKLIIYAVLGLVAIVLIGARVGLFAGRPPTDLGVSDGRLKAPSNSRNSISSQAVLYPAHPQADYARIAPFEFLDGDAAASMQALRGVLSAMPEIRKTMKARKPQGVKTNHQFGMPPKRVGISWAATLPESDIVPASMTGTSAARTPGIS